MRNFKLTPHLGVFFIIAVFVPSMLLAVISVRMLNREEAYIEKSLEGTLMAEVTHIVSLLNTELNKIQYELDRTAPGIDGDFSSWQGSNRLVEAAFLLSPEYQVVWPQSVQKTQVLAQNIDFLENKVKIPVYQNVASVYQNEVFQSVQSSDYSFSSRAKQSITQQDHPGIYRQMAVSQVQQDEPLRKRLYDQAEASGQQVLNRTVMLSKGAKGKMPVKEEKSLFIAEQMRFADIAGQAREGIVPRFIDNKLEFIFWKKTTGSYISGCIIDDAVLKDRLMGVMPDIYSSARIVTILDDNGFPLAVPSEKGTRNWRMPFVAKEISEVLPRWEVAAYLTDPGIISSTAQFRTMMMWALIIILFASIVSGGFIVFKALHNEMVLARQKTTFAANVSHELKTPLTSIRMFAEMLKEKRQPDQQKQQKYLGIMVSEAERLTRLINNVLDFSRRGQGKKQYDMKKTDIVLLVENIVESQRMRLEHNGFTINFHTEVGKLDLTVDEEAIKQAVINLLSNSEKYSKNNKQIEVEVARSKEHIIVSIKDRGIGIAAKHARDIFKEFYRIDDSLTSPARGTGLGLTITKKIIQDHKGDVLYFSRDGGGSIFQIKLPIKELA